MKNLTQFETGNIYEMRYIGDSNLRPEWICVKRTATTATFEIFGTHESMTRKIKVYEGSEYVLEGNYAMAARINAKNIIG